MNRSKAVAPLLFAALLVTPGLARAQHPPAADDSAKDPAALVRQALDQANAGHAKEAVALLEPLRDRPGTPAPVLATLGALYLQVDRPADAFSLLEPLAQPEDANAAVLYNAGRAALALGKIVKAEKLFERSVAKEPDTPASRELGLLRGQESRYHEALALLLPWARSHPDDHEARLAGAFAAIRVRRPPDAEELLSDLPQTDPQVRLAWGNLLLLKDDPPGAVSTLEPLVNAPEGKVPEAIQGDARRLLADAYLQLGQAENAASTLKDHAVGPASNLALARARYQAGDVDGAIETLRSFADSSLESDAPPDDPRWPLAADILRDFGRWLLAAGKAEEALPYLRLSSQVNARDKETWQALGQALAAAGQRDEAKKALAKFQELAKAAGNESARMNRIREAREDPTGARIDQARRLLAQGQAEDALKLLQGEIELEPQDVRPRLLASRALLVLGRPQEGLEAARQALALAPDNPDAVYQLGTANLALKNMDAAEADLRHALELRPRPRAGDERPRRPAASQGRARGGPEPAREGPGAAAGRPPGEGQPGEAGGPERAVRPFLTPLRRPPRGGSRAGSRRPGSSRPASAPSGGPRNGRRPGRGGR